MVLISMLLKWICHANLPFYLCPETTSLMGLPATIACPKKRFCYIPWALQAPYSGFEKFITAYFPQKQTSSFSLVNINFQIRFCFLSNADLWTFNVTGDEVLNVEEGMAPVERQGRGQASRLGVGVAWGWLELCCTDTFVFAIISLF